MTARICFNLRRAIAGHGTCSSSYVEVRPPGRTGGGSMKRTLWVLHLAIFMLCVGSLAIAQTARLDTGTQIMVRTNEAIDTNDADGRIYMGVVDQDVRDSNNRLVIPRSSDVELVVRKTSENELALDLDSIMINGQRYGVESEENVVAGEQKEGLGANKRTGKYVGGGAVLGAIIGGITGGGKGAAIGAGAGAAAGAGAQVLTRGGTVKVPAESLLTFRLAQPLRAGTADSGYLRNGSHYHGASSAVTPQNSASARQKPAYNTDRGSIRIGANNQVNWQGPENAKVYVQVDNGDQKLFASGTSGTQAAPWIQQGHVYVFVLKDANGIEIARAREDLRGRR